MAVVKKTLQYSTLGVCMLGLTACPLTGGDKKTDNQAQTPYPEATIGVTISSIESNPFFQGAYKAFEAIGTEQSAVTLLLDSAKDDQKLQLKQLEEMKNKGAKALIINLIEAEAGTEIVDKYCDSGMVLVFFDRSPGDKNLAKCQNAYLVHGDSNQAGITQGLQVLELWDKNPTWDKNQDGVIQFAMLEGIPGHSAAVSRTKWSIGTMKNYPNLGKPVQMIFQDTAMYQEGHAYNLVKSWMAKPDFAKVEVILANNDGMALGAVRALKEKNMRLPIFGVDGIDEAMQAIQSGDMAATVLNDYTNQAKAAMRLAANLVAGKSPLAGVDYKMEYRVIQVPYQNVGQSATE